MNIVVLLAKVGVITSLCYYAAATITAWRFARAAAHPAGPLPKIAPRIAVLKPLRGRSDGLAANLASYLEADYPRTEYYFAVSNYEDPAAEVPCALRAQYQFAPITMIVGGAAGCANKKVGKLIRMAERAEHAEIFVLSDADIVIDRSHLSQIVSELTADDKIGAVTCLYRAQHNHSFASRLEAMFVNTDFAPQVMLSEAIEPIRYALGATIAIKRKALEAIGGFRPLKDLLADDFHLGRLVTEAGYKVVLSRSVVTTSSEEKRVADFWQRQLRWARTFRTTRPASLATIMLHGPFWALLFVLASRFSLLSLGALALVLVSRIAMASFVTRRVLHLSGRGNDAWLVPLKDLIMTAVWFASLAGNEVHWGGRRLRILPGGAMQEISG